jgi:capsule biosynthesis phosphatase
MKNLIIDLDGTLTVDEKDVPYEQKRPNIEVIEQLKRYKKQGFTITINTSRNMRTYRGDVGKIKQNTLPIILEWLDRHQVPYDEVIVGKPWCGFEGFYVDDKAIRPSEFARKSYDEIIELLESEKRSR